MLFLDKKYFIKLVRDNTNQNHEPKPRILIKWFVVTRTKNKSWFVSPRTIFTNPKQQQKPSYFSSHHESFHEPKTTTKTKLFFVSSRIISRTQNNNKNQVIFRLITNHFTNQNHEPKPRTKTSYVSSHHEPFLRSYGSCHHEPFLRQSLPPNHNIKYHQYTKNLNHWVVSVIYKN